MATMAPFALMLANGVSIDAVAVTSEVFLVVVLQALACLPTIVVSALLVMLTKNRVSRLQAMIPGGSQITSHGVVYTIFFILLLISGGLTITAGTVIRSLPGSDNGVADLGWYDQVSWMIPASSMFFLLVLVVQIGADASNMTSRVIAFLLQCIVLAANTIVLVVAHSSLDVQLAAGLLWAPALLSLLFAVMLFVQFFSPVTDIYADMGSDEHKKLMDAENPDSNSPGDTKDDSPSGLDSDTESAAPVARDSSTARARTLTHL